MWNWLLDSDYADVKALLICKRIWKYFILIWEEKNMKYDGQNMEEQNIPVVKEIFSNAYPRI